MKNLTQETKISIYNDYNNNELKVSEIAERYGLLRGEVARIAVGMGAKPRTKKFGSKSGVKNKVCPNCKKVIEVKGARFCCYCGSDIRSRLDVLIEKNKQLLNRITEFPISSRDEFRDVLLLNIEELEKIQNGGKNK